MSQICEAPGPLAGGGGLMWVLKMWSSSALRGAELLCQSKQKTSKPNPNPKPTSHIPNTWSQVSPEGWETLGSVYSFLAPAEINPLAINPGQLLQGWTILSRRNFLNAHPETVPSLLSLSGLSPPVRSCAGTPRDRAGL